METSNSNQGRLTLKSKTSPLPAKSVEELEKILLKIAHEYGYILQKCIVQKEKLDHLQQKIYPSGEIDPFRDNFKYIFVNKSNILLKTRLKIYLVELETEEGKLTLFLGEKFWRRILYDKKLLKRVIEAAGDNLYSTKKRLAHEPKTD